MIIDGYFDSLETCPDDENFDFCVYCRENEDCIAYHTGPKCEELICFDPRGHFHGDLVNVFKAGLGVIDKNNNEELDYQEVEDFFSQNRTDEVTDEMFDQAVNEFFMMDWDNSGTIDITEAGRAIFLLTDPFSVWKEMSGGEWDLQTWMYGVFDSVEEEELISEKKIVKTMDNVHYLNMESDMVNWLHH